MHDSPAASATPSSVARYGGDTSTPTYTSASFAESIVQGSGFASPIAFATAPPSGPSLANMPAELLALSPLLHDQSSAEATLSTASAAMGRPRMMDIGISSSGMNARPRLRLTRPLSEDPVIPALRWGYGGCAHFRAASRR